MRKKKKILAIILTLILTVSSFANNGYVSYAKEKKTVKSVTITNVDSPVLVLKKNSTYKLKIKVNVTGGASKKVTYSSSKPKVVSVSSKGKLKAKKKGTATITVKSTFNSKKKVKLKVKVGTPIKKITLKQKNVSLKVGETSKLSVTVSPKKPTRKTLSYSSSDKSVATVNKNGVITAVAAGTAKITVKATDGSKKKAVAKITVIKDDATTETPKDDPTTETPKDDPTTETPKDDPTTEKPGDSPSTETPGNDNNEIVYTEEDLVWSDEFEGDSLNTEDWNVELHEAGWVNAELQEYVNSDDNIFVKDGNLVLKAIKTVDENGNTSYTSGRVNTQGKHDFKYGRFEASLKVPEGKGFLPAFWMMPTNENLYGQWPKCGEIDIMEVMGQENNLVYGTLHYGEPHEESQGTYTLTDGNFTDDYHVFACEWEPGKIKWYVDGKLYHEENDWYSAREGQGTVTYPAPFDQSFYMIFNLAVGGSWVGYPDETTSFDDAELLVDWVKVYQKDAAEYDENVQKPEKPFVEREPDADGNYVNNGDFAVNESLADNEDWVFMTALEGEAEAVIQDNAIVIQTENEGTVDYSVQLVQAGIPFQKGASYELSFDAQASDARTMKTAVKGPDRNWVEYMPSETVELTTEKQSYTYVFKMNYDSDANGRLEFNMGIAGSTADITISNVVIKKVQAADPNEKEDKTILADGNYVYNGSFQEGTGRLGYWEITNNVDAQITVTGIEDGRRLKVTVDRDDVSAEDVQIAQSDLAITGGKEYVLSFEAQADADTSMKVVVAGQEREAELTVEKQTYSFNIATEEELSDKNIVFYMGEKGTIWLDDVRLADNALIKNGSFDAGFAGYDPFIDSSAKATYVVDSLEEDNAASFTISDTGDQNWKIQLKQESVHLENGKWYTLKFDAKSSLTRKVLFAIQRNGNIHNDDWTPYIEDTVTLTSEYQTFERTFQMKEDTDTVSVFNISMGAVDGQITEQHTIVIDNISLEELDGFEPAQPDAELLKNGNFDNDGEGWETLVAPAEWLGGEEAPDATVSFEGNEAVFDIRSAGSENWHIQLKQGGVQLEQGSEYTIKFNATSTASRSIEVGLLSEDNAYYGGKTITLEAGAVTSVEIPVKMEKATDTAANFIVSLGKIGDTPASKVTISDVSLVKKGKEIVEIVPKEPGVELLQNADFSDDMASWEETIANWGDAYSTVASREIQDKSIIYTIENAGTDEWHVQLKQGGVQLEEGMTYVAKFTVSSTAARNIKFLMQSGDELGYLGYYEETLFVDGELEVERTFTMNEATDPEAFFVISMGQIGTETIPASTITISNLSLMKLPAEGE